MSPVPGGRSITRKSGSSQNTSVRNCSSALCSIGPRQMTGWSSAAKKPIEMERTRWASGGTSIWSMTTGACRKPSMRGIEKPHTSASTTATSLPRRARATDRLVVTDDLPTPPLPEAISSTRVLLPGSANGISRPSAWPCACWLPAVAPGSPWSLVRRAARSSSVMTVKSRSNPSTPSSAVTAPVTRLVISMRRTMSRSTMLRCSSGSWTGRRASRTWASETGMTLLAGGGISTTAIGRIPAVDRPPLSPTEFASAVTAITSAFGDPTRREIYLFVHEHATGATAAAVAEHFALHPNVARHHLDKLVAGGYVEGTVVRPVGGGAGRAPKRHPGVAPAIALDLPLRHDDILVELLGRALAELGHDRAERIAESVGIDYGAAMAAAMSPGSDRK